MVGVLAETMTSLSVLLVFLYRSPSSSLYMIFEVISINPSANVFVFEDFNVHYIGWLTYSGRPDTPGKLCYNFSISNCFYSDG